MSTGGSMMNMLSTRTNANKLRKSDYVLWFRFRGTIGERNMRHS